jgi:hypothetical protein
LKFYVKIEILPLIEKFARPTTLIKVSTELDFIEKKLAAEPLTPRVIVNAYSLCLTAETFENGRENNMLLLCEVLKAASPTTD